MVATSARKGADEPLCAQATDRDVYVGGVEEVAGEPGQAPLCSRGLKKKLCGSHQLVHRESESLWPWGQNEIVNLSEKRGTLV